jgi:hypothetical protein
MSDASDHDGDPPADGEPDSWVEVDVDATFAAIVARFAQTGTVIGPWSVAEDLDAAPPGRDRDSAPDATSTEPTSTEPTSTDTASADTASADTASATPTTTDLASAEPRPDDDTAKTPPEGSSTADDRRRSRHQDDDGFVPPVPPPLPRGDFLTTFAWVCVLGGPLFLLFAAFAWRDVPGLLVLTGVAAFVGGFAALAARLPGEPPDDPDDGAVV